MRDDGIWHAYMIDQLGRAVTWRGRWMLVTPEDFWQPVPPITYPFHYYKENLRPHP